MVVKHAEVCISGPGRGPNNIKENDMIYKGQSVLVQTFTAFFTGRVKDINKDWVVLEDAAWIAHTGRFSEFLTGSPGMEIEPYPELLHIRMSAILAFTPWNHSLPRKAV